MEIDIKQILLQILNFGVLFFILAKFLFRPILDIIDKRSTKIEEGLALAERNKKAQEQIEHKSNELLEKAEKKGALLIEQARKESKELGKQLLESAKLESEKTISKQQATFLEHMRDEERQFKSRVTDLVLTTTQKVLTDSLSPKEVKLITKKEIENSAYLDSSFQCITDSTAATSDASRAMKRPNLRPPPPAPSRKIINVTMKQTLVR